MTSQTPREVREPPRLARAILSLALPPGIVGTTILGDLDELHGRYPAGRWHERLRADLWYWRQVVGVGGGYLWRRLRRDGRLAAVWAGEFPPGTGRAGIGSSRDVHAAARGLRWLDGIGSDVRHALRVFRRNPGFTAVAVVMLGIGIGVNVSVFTITNAVLFKGFPLVSHNDRILYLDTRRDGEGCCVAYPDFLEWQEQTESFVGLGAVADRQVMLSDVGTDPERHTAAVVSANTFSLVRQVPVLGRAFTESDQQPGAAPVAILRHEFWERRYGEDSGVVGRTVSIDGVPTTVIGVMPRGFSFPENLDLWLPLVPTPDLVDRTTGLWFAFGRLADGVSADGARAEMQIIGGRLAAANPSTNDGTVPVVHTFADFFIGPNAKAIYGALVAGVGIVLLIACANLASLLLGRVVTRAHEIAVRASLGAGRSRIIRQLVIESITLSSLGGALGWLVAKGTLRLYEAWAVPSGQFILGTWFDHVLDFGLDHRGFVYVCAISLLSGVSAGLVPALRLSDLANDTTSYRVGRGTSPGPRGRRVATFLVTCETALAVILLAGAGVLVRSVVNLSTTDVGVNTDDVVAMLVRLPTEEYPDTDAQVGLYDRLARQLASIPGVEGVALASSPPAGGAPALEYELADEAPSDEHRRATASVVTVGADYFRVMGTNVVAGREFGEVDRASAPPVALVNQLYAEQHWPGEGAVGKRLRLFDRGAPGPWLTVAGVVSNVVQSSLARQTLDPLIYLPVTQHPARSTWILTRTRPGQAGIIASVRHEVVALDRDLLVWLGPFLLSDYVASGYAFQGVVGVLSSMFATIALLLAVAGVYVVVARSVGERTREIGVRVVMGATPSEILALIFGEDMIAVGSGALLGVAGSVFVNRALSAVLVGVAPADPLTLGLSVSTLLLAAIVGCAVPARRAIAIDPAVALRHE